MKSILIAEFPDTDTKLYKKGNQIISISNTRAGKKVLVLGGV